MSKHLVAGSAIVAALLATTLTGGSLASNGRPDADSSAITVDDKVDVCHRSGQRIRKLNIDAVSLPDHRGHGDAIPGEFVPGSTTLVYDNTCTGVSVGIDIEKTTNGLDADSPTGPLIDVGDPVEWVYVVTNTGGGTLVSVQVGDDQTGVVSCPLTTLAAGASMTCIATGTATADQYANVGTASGVTKGVDGDEQFVLVANQGQPSDSDSSHYFGSDAAITIEKSTNGDDADAAPGPTIIVGDPVNWTYQVTNAGNVALTSVGVADDQGVAVSCPKATLAVGESMTCTGSGSAVEGQYSNIGTAVGTSPTGTEVDATDSSHYLGATPEDVRGAIVIEKSTNGFDADSAPGPEIIENSSVTWTYQVTNVGTDVLNSVSVTDDQIGAVSCPLSSLAPTESMTCSAAGTAQLGQYVNVGTATGTITGTAVTVSSSDTSHYFGIPVPSAVISIEKTTNGLDADSAPGPTLSVGAIVVWQYTVTNTGDIALFPITVTDSDPSVTPDCAELDEDGPLLPGESRTCTASGPVLEGQYENTGTATGTPSDAQGNPTGGADVEATDLSHYTGVTTASDSIDIQKFTETRSGALSNADVAPGPTLYVGQTVGWIYEVRNTGSTVLTGVTVTDNQGVAVTCPGSVLLPGGTLRCSASGVVTLGQYSNIGTVNATSSPGGVAVSDTDPSHYLGVVAPASIDIEKSTNGADADAAPGPTLAAGDTVTWTYVVTNNGSSDLTGVTVTDNDGSLVVDCSPGIPDPFLAGASFTCTATGTATQGQYQNVGRATGQSVPGTIVSDSDRSHYFVPLPTTASIRLEKSTNGFDADNPTDPMAQIPEGQTVSWVYRVTNTGGVNLFNVTITDDQLGLVCQLGTGGSSLGFLAPNTTEQCEMTGTAAIGIQANTGTVTARPGDVLGTCPGDPGCVSDTDTSHYEGLGPVAIDVEKATNGVDADNTPVMLTVGDTVTWSYVVTNTSDVALGNIVVTDDLEGAVTCPQTTLASGASMTCTDKTGIATQGLYVNVASATGAAADGRQAFDSDRSRYAGKQVEAPTTAVDIETFTNGINADTGPGPSLPVGSNVFWTYVVTNTGTTTIGSSTVLPFAVTDSSGAAVVCPFATLAPGQSVTCSLTGTVLLGLNSNVGTVEVTSGATVVASDTDSSNYTGVEPNDGR